MFDCDNRALILREQLEYLLDHRANPGEEHQARGCAECRRLATFERLALERFDDVTFQSAKRRNAAAA